MKMIIREKVWDSISSSCHSLVYKHRDLQPSNLRINPETHKVIVHIGCYDDEAVYDTQEEKLAYLLAHVYYDNGYDLVNLCNCYEFGNIEESITEYINKHKSDSEPDCEGIEIDPTSEIELNHQLVGDLNDIVNIWREDEVVNFVFDGNVELSIWKD